MVWEDDLQLWSDAIRKAPKSSRAKINLAKVLIDHGRYQEALLLLEDTNSLPGATKNKDAPMILNAKSAIAFSEGNYEASIGYLEQALHLRNDYTDAAYKLIDQNIKLERFEEALAIVNKRYETFDIKEMLLIKSVILLHLNRPTDAIDTLNTARYFFPNSFLITVGLGKATSMLGNFKQADYILRAASAANEPGALYLRIENSIKWGYKNYSLQMIEHLITSMPTNKLLTELAAPPLGAFLVPLDTSLVKSEVVKVMANKLD